MVPAVFEGQSPTHLAKLVLQAVGGPEKCPGGSGGDPKDAHGGLGGVLQPLAEDWAHPAAGKAHLCQPVFVWGGESTSLMVQATQDSRGV